MAARGFFTYVLLSTVIFGVSVIPAAAVDFVVTLTDDQVDSNPGNGVCSVDGTPGNCSLRAAIQEANHLAGSDRITIPAGIWYLDLTGEGEDSAATGDLDIYDNLEIIGAGSALVTINGSLLGDRIFHLTNQNSMDPAPTVTIEGVTITGGQATTALTFLGGGLFMESYGTLNMTDVRVIGNQANQGGGMEVIGGAGTISDCSFLDNTALDVGVTNAIGGGLYASSAQIEITASTFSNNSSAVGSGGVYGHGCDQMRIISSTLAWNVGIAIGSWNSNVEIVQSTIVTDSETGISFGSYDGANTLSLAGTVLTGNAYQNCAINSGIYTHSTNVESGNSCGFDTSAGELIDTDPKLGALGDNGGPTETCEPLPGSPLIDLMAGADPNCLWEDQRGVRRPLDGNWDGVADCDVGAVESTLIFADGFESATTDQWSGVSL